MTYKLSISRKAQKQLAKLPANDYKKVKQTILDLADEPRPAGSKKLKGRNGWRVRQGDYRIIYDIEDDVLVVTVLDAGHRKDIYKK
ncbi:type II toxin-antitoxin system RelE family toxin [Saccharicrinis fermentans]|uniref:Toxin RelG n=1 Tax=Saccharicrinis fermentans DSM 9555 = JCM 21142 TaxID=869213 RepID=W7YQU5_9BACT|nr:type II toxin-antitoxin system RelE/ParE family toxin [Saccharicrinis fermentans]GAF04804.1 toxin RelG [Saccharicrinis fermentans DSM 9555 = JCM 21142]